MASVTGKEPGFDLCPGLLETRFYAAHGIPAFAYGSGLLSASHGPNDFVPILNITHCVAIYALTAADAFGSTASHLIGHVELGGIPGLVALVSQRDELHVETIGVIGISFTQRMMNSPEPPRVSVIGRWLTRRWNERKSRVHGVH